MTELLRVYSDDELGTDGYPRAWHKCPYCAGKGGRITHVYSRFAGTEPQVHEGPWETCSACEGAGSIKDMVRQRAGHRCVRCGHPYRKGEHGKGEWSPCDTQCTHGDAIRIWVPCEGHPESDDWFETKALRPVGELVAESGQRYEAHWRILTVHHLQDGHEQKRDCRWWNLVALDQRCHLQIQGKVQMNRIWAHEHSEWFKPYVAGWYAWTYEGREITREEAEERMDELLAHERIA